jgi:hypothetical protein
MPECMDGILRVGNVIVEYEDRRQISRQDLVDNTEYHTEIELVNDISRRIGVSKDKVEVYY